MLIVLQHPERLLSCTVQFQTKARVFLEITVRAREWEKSGKANEHKERERNKAQRESLSAANTDRVMHQDLVPCLHRSFEWPILCTDTHSCSVLSLCVNNSLLLWYHKIVQRAKSGRKDAHSYLNPRGYLSILPKMSKLNRLLVALKPASFIFLLAFSSNYFLCSMRKWHYFTKTRPQKTEDCWSISRTNNK